jgi:transcriptional antiterminator NusG
VHWYLVRVSPGKERQLSDQFNTDIELGNIIGVKRFICPTEKQVKLIKNKKVLRDKVIYTGYIYFEAEHDLTSDELKNLPFLTSIFGILGDRTPLKLNKRDVSRIIKEDQQPVGLNIDYAIGETVKVIEGPFRTFDGKVHKIEGEKVDVEVKIFGRPTKVTLSKGQIDKV